MKWKDGRAQMQGDGDSRQHPGLKDLVVKTSRALARLDAGRMEELALSCQSLNRELAAVNLEQREALAIQAREAAGDMAVFARVLEATRANLQVMNRLRELREGRLEYGESAARISAGAESGHGDD